MENNTNTSVENTTPNTEGTGTNQGIESAIEKGKEQKENAILKSYFKQQGMEEAEIQEAIKTWKDAKAQKALEEENAKKEAEAQKDQAIKEAEAKAEAAMNLLKEERMTSAVQNIAISLGVDPAKLSLVSRLIDKSTITIDENFKVDESSAKKAIEEVLEMVPEFKKAPETVQNFKFGAAKEDNSPKPSTKNLSLREGLALRYS